MAENPLFQGSLSWKKLQATVVNDIWPEVLFFTLVATSKDSLPTQSPGAHLALFHSGCLCKHADSCQFGCLKSVVDRVGYGVGFGHLFPNFVRL